MHLISQFLFLIFKKPSQFLEIVETKKKIWFALFLSEAKTTHVTIAPQLLLPRPPLKAPSAGHCLLASATTSHCHLLLPPNATQVTIKQVLSFDFQKREKIETGFSFHEN